MSPPIKSVRRNNDNKNSLVKKPGFKYQGAGLAERGTFISFSDTGAYETNLKISQSMFEANNEVIEKGGINPEDIRGFKAYVNFNASNPVSLYSPSYKKNSDKSEIFLVISSKIKDFDGTDTNVTSCAGNLKDVFILEYGQFLYNQNRLSYKEMSDVWKKYVNPELKRDIKKFLSIAATEHISVNGKNINGGKYVGEFFAGAVTGKVHLTDKQGKKRTECDFTPTKEMIKLYVALKGPAIPNILQGYVPGEPYDVDKEFEAGHINLKIGE